ncbi:MAG: hypothetical protein ACTSUB_03560, partial [Candidatus Thorarchaeota archaeon]
MKRVFLLILGIFFITNISGQTQIDWYEEYYYVEDDPQRLYMMVFECTPTALYESTLILLRKNNRITVVNPSLYVASDDNYMISEFNGYTVKYSLIEDPARGYSFTF